MREYFHLFLREKTVLFYSLPREKYKPNISLIDAEEDIPTTFLFGNRNFLQSGKPCISGYCSKSRLGFSHSKLDA